MALSTIFLDFETYYAKDYTLRRMTPVEYVLDHRFEAICCGVKEGADGTPYLVDGPDLPKFFASLDPTVTQTVTHNALFDACIMAWRFGFVPRLMTCTLAMARASLGHALKNGGSLAKVATHLGLGVKGGAVYKVEGMVRADIIASRLWDEYVQYCLNDVELCAGAYGKMLGSVFPVRELAVLDMVLRCAVEPKLVLDQALLHQHLAEVQAKKDALLARVATLAADGKSSLMSNERFADCLRQLGVDPPTKISPVTGRVAFAFAKTDPGLLELEDHPDPDVQALVAARLGHKTTLEETRTERFISISNLTWPGNQQRLMPVPLGYGRAHTHRLGGEWKLNMQNLPRGGNLRRALTAPEGYKVVVADAAQVEARISAWLCGQEDLLLQFRNKEDVYCKFASHVYGRQITKADKMERFVGKTGVLGLGYMTGWKKLQRTLKLLGGVEVDEDEARRIVRVFRETYSGYPKTWNWLGTKVLDTLRYGGVIDWKGCHVEKDKIRLPSGLHLHYPNIIETIGEDGNRYFNYLFAGQKRAVYGGKLLENITQALARITTFDAALQIQRRTGYRLAQQVHDEVVFVVKDEDVEQVKQITVEEMSLPPAWAPGLPLSAEAGAGQSYGEAK